MDSAVDPPILSCSDSPLSTTASIISILTFALGLLASYVALQSATRGAPSEIVRLIDDLRSTQHEINRVAEYIFDDAHNQFTAAHASFTRPVGITSPPVSINGQSSFANNVLYEEVQVLLGNCVRLFYEADDLLKRTKSEVDRWDPEGLRRRIIFVMNRHEMGEKMQRLGDQKAKLGAIQMSLFMKKSVMQDAMLKQIAENIKQVSIQNAYWKPFSDDSESFVPRGEKTEDNALLATRNERDLPRQIP